MLQSWLPMKGAENRADFGTVTFLPCNLGVDSFALGTLEAQSLGFDSGLYTY